MLKERSNTHKVPLSKDQKTIVSRHFRKSLSDHELFTKITNQTSVAIHDKEHRLYKVSLEKSLNNKT